MTDEKSKERIVVEISSSDESKLPPWQLDDDAVEDISSSTSCNDDDDDGEECSPSSYSEDEDKAEVGGDEESDISDVDKHDVESMCNKVIQFIQARGDMQELKADECKAYLRRHKLRLSGSKEDCVERIKEHWKLKDVNGEIFYPRSSFSIDCTGDVCKGDIVLFHQKVHQTSGKTVRNRTAGRRTVAGRIIKESYGATRQQHTFTLWKNEKEREEVLAEKHRRGNAARTIRAMRRSKGVMRKNESLAFKGSQHCVRFHHVSPSRTRETSLRKKNCLNEGGKMDRNKKRIHPHRSAYVSSKRSAGSAHYSIRQKSPNKVIQSPSLSDNHRVAPFCSHQHAGSRGYTYHNSPYQVRQSPSLSYGHSVALFRSKQNAGSRGSAECHNSPD